MALHLATHLHAMIARHQHDARLGLVQAIKTTIAILPANPWARTLL